VLDEWSDLPFFLRLQAGSHVGMRVRGVFDASAQLYRHVWRQRIADLIQAFIAELQSVIAIYVQERWYDVILIDE
jgi:hypothetical protein